MCSLYEGSSHVAEKASNLRDDDGMSRRTRDMILSAFTWTKGNTECCPLGSHVAD